MFNESSIWEDFLDLVSHVIIVCKGDPTEVSKEHSDLKSMKTTFISSDIDKEMPKIEEHAVTQILVIGGESVYLAFLPYAHRILDFNHSNLRTPKDLEGSEAFNSTDLCLEKSEGDIRWLQTTVDWVCSGRAVLRSMKSHTRVTQLSRQIEMKFDD